jgi:tRNA(Ile)-lysidine synthase
VLPLLEDVLQGGVAEALARTAALVRDDLDALDALSSVHGAGRPVVDAGSSIHGARSSVDRPSELDATALAPWPRAVRRRALRSWARHGGAGALSAVHLAALDALVVDWHGQGPVDLPGGRVVRASGKLLMNPPPAVPQE